MARYEIEKFGRLCKVCRKKTINIRGRCGKCMESGQSEEDESTSWLPRAEPVAVRRGRELEKYRV